jgi:hypothetical protein
MNSRARVIQCGGYGLSYPRSTSTRRVSIVYRYTSLNISCRYLPETPVPLLDDGSVVGVDHLWQSETIAGQVDFGPVRLAHRPPQLVADPPIGNIPTTSAARAVLSFGKMTNGGDGEWSAAVSTIGDGRR